MKLKRRPLLGGLATGVVAPQSLLSSAADNAGAEVLRIGVIGAGVRGKYLIGNLPPQARVVAICDCATSRLDAVLDSNDVFSDVLRGFREKDAANCKTYQDYRRLIGQEKLDAVIIATPDHHHVPAAMLALDAGLDVYLEKPLSLGIAEGRRLVEKVKATGRVLQVGSQQRSMEMNRFACEFVRDGGLGKITHVEVSNYPGPLPDPVFPAEPVPPGMNWNLFIGDSPRRPHNRKLWVKDEFEVDGLLWRGWDLYRDYSGHMTTNWGAHAIDMVQYALGKDDTGPVKITPHTDADVAEVRADWEKKWHLKTPPPQGPWRDATRFHPVTLEYADGITLKLTPGVAAPTFHGERGTMQIPRNGYRADPADLVTDPPDPNLSRKWDGGGNVARPHLQNWLDCISSRQTPRAPAEVGHRTATVCHLANLARHLGRPLRWDPIGERFRDDPEADAMLG